MSEAILELQNIKKLYPGVVALNDVSLSFKKGEVHAICGENGAGKSTFIKIITGCIEPTEGKVIFEGQEILNNSPTKSLDLGIACIYQEFNLVPYLSVAENIFYGRYPKKGMFVDFNKMEKDTENVTESLGISLDPKELVKNLTVGYQQIVEIAKSISREVKVLLMDEPSAPLTNNELVYLFKIVEKLKEEGVTIIYISHRMEEIFEICDRVSVFRDGEYIDTKNIADTDEKELICMMVGRDICHLDFPSGKYSKGKKVLEAKSLINDYLKDVSFEAYEGEILGFAGLVGAGRTEVARAVFGADALENGDIYIDGQKELLTSPKIAILNGVGLIPEDRKRHGALLHMSVLDNITYGSLAKFSNKFGIIDRKKEEEEAAKLKNAMRIKTPNLLQKTKNLSGGNQQKVVLGKWMLTDSKVLIFDEPTRGIDVGAKQEIYHLMNELVEQGKVVIMISSEMPELLGMSDRIIVMNEGKVEGEISNKQIKEDKQIQEKVLAMASGQAI